MLVLGECVHVARVHDCVMLSYSFVRALIKLVHERERFRTMAAILHATLWTHQDLFHSL
jgi:hypothetical protein